MRRAALLLAGLLAAPPPALAADVVAGAPSGLGVVIYRDPNGGRDGVAMIVETREVDLPAEDSEAVARALGLSLGRAVREAGGEALVY